MCRPGSHIINIISHMLHHTRHLCLRIGTPTMDRNNYDLLWLSDTYFPNGVLEFYVTSLLLSVAG